MKALVSVVFVSGCFLRQRWWHQWSTLLINWIMRLLSTHNGFRSVCIPNKAMPPFCWVVVERKLLFRLSLVEHNICFTFCWGFCGGGTESTWRYPHVHQSCKLYGPITLCISIEYIHQSRMNIIHVIPIIGWKIYLIVITILNCLIVIVLHLLQVIKLNTWPSELVITSTVLNKKNCNYNNNCYKLLK